MKSDDKVNDLLTVSNLSEELLLLIHYPKGQQEVKRDHQRTSVYNPRYHKSERSTDCIIGKTDSFVQRSGSCNNWIESL
jgi:hypothetical protein